MVYIVQVPIAASTFDPLSLCEKRRRLPPVLATSDNLIQSSFQRSCCSSPYPSSGRRRREKRTRGNPRLHFVSIGKLINMHRFHNAILIVQAGPSNRHAPNGRIGPHASHDVCIEAAIRMGQLDVPLARTLGAPSAIATAGDPLLALASDIAIVIESVMDSAATGRDALIRRGEFVAVR